LEKGKRIAKRYCQRNDATEENKCDLEKQVENFLQDSTQLREYRRRKQKKGLLSCIYCQYYSKRRMELYRHVAAVHMQSHLGAKYVAPGNQCGICGGVFRSRNGLSNHLGNVHTHKTIPQKLIDANPRLKSKFNRSQKENTVKRKLSIWSCFRCSREPTSPHNAICHLVTHFKSEVNLLFMYFL